MSAVPRTRTMVVTPLETANPTGVLSLQNATNNVTNYPTGPVIANQANACVAFLEQIRMDDIVTDDFISKRSSGQLLAANPMTKYHVKCTSAGLLGFTESRHLSGSTTLTSKKGMLKKGPYLSNPSYTGDAIANKLWLTTTNCPSIMSTTPPTDRTIPFSAGDLLSFRDLAVTQAYSNIGQAEFELGVLLGEAKETFSYGVLNYNRISKFIMSFIRQASNVKKASKTTESWYQWWAGAWLEFRFSLMPMISEFYNFLEADLSKNIVRNTARGYHSVSTQTQYKYDSVHCSLATHTFGKFLEWRNNVSTWTCNTRGYVTYDCELSDFMAVIRNLGLTDPLDVAYQLTTLSFLVDYFINLGDFMKSLTPNVGVKQQVAGYTQEITLTSVTTTGYEGNPRENLGFIPLSQAYTWTKKIRLPVETQPLSPTLDVNLDFNRVTDILALAKSMLFKLK